MKKKSDILTQKEKAQFLGFRQPHMSRILSGKMAVSPVLAHRLSLRFKSIDWWMSASPEQIDRLVIREIQKEKRNRKATLKKENRPSNNQIISKRFESNCTEKR